MKVAPSNILGEFWHIYWVIVPSCGSSSNPAGSAHLPMERDGFGRVDMGERYFWWQGGPGYFLAGAHEALRMAQWVE